MYLLKLGETGADISLEALVKALGEIADCKDGNTHPTDESAPGLLTCASHATQMPIFQQLQINEINKESLHKLRDSFLTLCLDMDAKPETDSEAARLAQSTNLENRWQHSSTQIVVFGNGKAVAICNFNAYVDGNTMMRGAAEIQKRAAQVSLETPEGEPPSGNIQVEKLNWDIPEEFVEKAKRTLPWSLMTSKQHLRFQALVARISPNMALNQCRLLSWRCKWQPES